MTASDDHRQLSFIPLPSIGHEHTDPGVRRVMIVAPLGDNAWLDHVARHIAGNTLEPVRENEFIGQKPPILVPVRHDKVSKNYTEPASTWHSFTPVILDGHVKRRKEKHPDGRELEVTDHNEWIAKALLRAGIEQPCEFEWSPFSRFPQSYSAHKYDKNKRPQGYIRPDHLLSQTAVHLTLRFHDGSAEKKPIKVPGPLIIGAGRHCGFGLMARERE